jgi:hypothetical protein
MAKLTFKYDDDSVRSIGEAQSSTYRLHLEMESLYDDMGTRKFEKIDDIIDQVKEFSEDLDFIKGLIGGALKSLEERKNEEYMAEKKENLSMESVYDDMGNRLHIRDWQFKEFEDLDFIKKMISDALKSLEERQEELESLEERKNSEPIVEQKEDLSIAEIFYNLLVANGNLVEVKDNVVIKDYIAGFIKGIRGINE